MQCEAGDLVATLRARAIRIALFTTMMLRPDPDHPFGDVPESLHIVLNEQVEAMYRVKALLTGKPSFDHLPPSICGWVARVAGTLPAQLTEVLEFIDQSAAVARAAQDDRDDASRLLAQSIERGKTLFFDAVTDICNALWADLDARRRADIARAAQAGEAIDHTLERLEYIGKHVRLVSLNASVEAARAGQAGRGLAVIAQEFKELAEEIQSLATRARTQIDEVAQA